ncbi:MAG: hypothetical protein WA632_14035, partial [Gallionella sp.]
VTSALLYQLSYSSINCVNYRGGAAIPTSGIPYRAFNLKNLPLVGLHVTDSREATAAGTPQMMLGLSGKLIEVNLSCGIKHRTSFQEL